MREGMFRFVRHVGFHCDRWGVAFVRCKHVRTLGDFRLGVGVWIVLGIIILVIAIIVGYCIYQKKCGKSEEYQQPNEQKQAEQQQNPV